MTIAVGASYRHFKKFKCPGGRESAEYKQMQADYIQGMMKAFYSVFPNAKQYEDNIDIFTPLDFAETLGRTEVLRGKLCRS